MDGSASQPLTVRASAASCPARLGISPGCTQGHQVVPLETAIRASVPLFQVIHQLDTPSQPRRLATVGLRARPSGRPARGGKPGSSPGHRAQPTFSMGEDGPRCTWLVPQGRPLRRSVWSGVHQCVLTSRATASWGQMGPLCPCCGWQGFSWNTGRENHKPTGLFLAEEARAKPSWSLNLLNEPATEPKAWGYGAAQQRLHSGGHTW